LKLGRSRTRKEKQENFRKKYKKKLNYVYPSRGFGRERGGDEG